MSVIVKEDGTGKVIVDTRPQDQLEPLKPLSQPITGSAFFGEAEMEKVGENRHHLRYDFSKFRALPELRPLIGGGDTEKLWPTLSIDADENALVLTPDPTVKKSRMKLPVKIAGDFAFRANLLGASEGVFQIQIFGGQHILVNLHGSNSTEKEPTGTVDVCRIKGQADKEILGKMQVVVNQKNELPFKLPGKLVSAVLVLNYMSDVPFGVSSLDLIADFQPTYGIEWQVQGTKITVKQVYPGTSGELAGVKIGDQLKMIDGISPSDLDTALQVFADADIEKELPIEIVRLGRTRTLMLKPGGVLTSGDIDKK